MSVVCAARWTQSDLSTALLFDRASQTHAATVNRSSKRGGWSAAAADNAAGLSRICAIIFFDIQFRFCHQLERVKGPECGTACLQTGRRRVSSDSGANGRWNMWKLSKDTSGRACHGGKREVARFRRKFAQRSDRQLRSSRPVPVAASRRRACMTPPIGREYRTVELRSVGSVEAVA